MAAFDVLATLISQAPEPMRPVLTHVGRMIQDLRSELNAHAGDNVTEFGNVSTQLTTMADRVNVAEAAVTNINSTLVTVSAQLDAVQQGLGASNTLEQAPTIVAIKGEVAALATALSDVPNAITKLNDGIDGLRAQFNDPSSLQNAPLIQQMQAEIGALQSTAAAPPGTSVGPSVSGGGADVAQIAAAVGDAVAKALNSAAAPREHTSD